MVRDTERRLLPWLAGAAALLLVVTGVSIVTLHRALEDVRRIAHGKDVIAGLRSAHLCVAELEAAVRGYLLTGDQAFVAPAPKVQDAARQHLERVRSLTSEDPPQQRRLDRLAAAFETRWEHVDAVTRARAAGRMPDEEVVAALETGAREMEAIHDAVGGMLREEEGTIARRTETAESGTRSMVVALAAMVGVVILVLAGGFLLVHRDLALRRVTEADLVRAKDAAELANRELEAFSYSVSHDLRTPLRAIDGFSQTLLEEHAADLAPEAQADLRRVRAAAQRMGELIDDLLRLSRVSRTELRRGRVDLSRTARAVAAELAAADPARRVEVVVEDGIVAEADPALVRIALENLLGNAWKFTGKVPDARIEFRVLPKGDEVVYVVRDNGAGFDAAYVERLFTPFQRLHGAKEFPGTGIGLATVRRAVLRHGGRVWAEGEVGEGAAFFFTLG